jgi:hypothetical protein
MKAPLLLPYNSQMSCSSTLRVFFTYKAGDVAWFWSAWSLLGARLGSAGTAVIVRCKNQYRERPHRKGLYEPDMHRYNRILHLICYGNTNQPIAYTAHESSA